MTNTSCSISLIRNGEGALPYTILVEPGGKIVYAKQGTIDPAKMKETSGENLMIGRCY